MNKYNTLQDVLKDYFQTHDLAAGSVVFYTNTVKVFENWRGTPISFDEFTYDLVNTFLTAKREQVPKLSSHYRKSLRNGLRSILRFAGKEGTIQQVKWQRLDPKVWTPEQVEQLLQACPNWQWQIRVALGYVTGLNAVDLELITKADIVDGVLKWRRQKTQKLVLIRIPDWLYKQLPNSGPICPRTTTEEWLRRQFRQIVLAAGLEGSFKKLRKSSGTSVEASFPGCGHLFLGNTRNVFELHYLDAERGLTPMSPLPTEPQPPPQHEPVSLFAERRTPAVSQPAAVERRQPAEPVAEDWL